MAILAGDSLLTLAFQVLSELPHVSPAIAVALIRELSTASGTVDGMIGGQALDLKSQAQELDVENLILMHEMKTGALIRVSAEGAALACGLPAEKRQLCREFGGLLGFAFQLKDDLLDSAVEIEKGSMPARIGLAETERRLIEITARARVCLRGLGLEKSDLAELLTMNVERTH
jgi:geranylgeranyl pyrophosphate synthase